MTNKSKDMHKNDTESSVNKDAIIEEDALPIRIFRIIWNNVIERQILQKIFSLIFSLCVIIGVYFYMTPHHAVMGYVAVVLLLVIIYAEMLVIRDHLWVIEGSSHEARKWRDTFFNPRTMRWQRIRKLAALLFALGIFVYVYVKSTQTPTSSFFGVILMMTLLYYEILSIRDEVHSLSTALKAKEKSDKLITSVLKETIELHTDDDKTPNDQSTT